MGLALIVDDDPVSRRVTARAIERAGHGAIVTVDGESALELLASVDLDVMVVDLHLPGIDGLEFVRRAWAASRGDQPSVVLMTSSAADDVLARAASAGVEDVLRKPLGSREIARCVLPRLGTSRR